ncbi:MAG: hypothetical protein KME18_07090 [Phormidium tanganyikae FI6-MK23]|jgi:hypothetical protein|nr:hypothetical protein [Phormidium tanganyikae FI6-MK23]
MSILLDSFFEPKAAGHGGNRRSAQILELIDRANLTVTKFDRQLLSNARDRYLAGIKSLLNPKNLNFVLRHQIHVQPSFKNIAFCGFQRQLYDRVLTEHSGTKLLLWEATKNYVAPYLAKDKGFQVIAMPHNLESFVSDQTAFHESLSTEIQALAKADCVFCIAREEEWLLRLHGVNAHYLPYYPPQAIEQHLSKIRSDRRPSARYLILGSASNPPTRQGMIEQIQWLKHIRQHFSFEVDIVGYGTEALQEYCDETFVLHGAIDEERLTAILIQAKAALIHQTASSGALTRIPELLIAGIPVIANGNACRSAFDYAGVYCYDDLFELLDRLNQPLETPAPVARPIAAEKRLIDALFALSQPV